jgi:glycosyltransferase involved in cell wall biosynthesis
VPLLVAVVTLTIPGREDFLAKCRRDVKRQTYPNIVHIEVNGPEVKGTKRNIGAEMAIAAGADIIVNADDDDLILPTSVETRVNALIAGAELCGTSLYHAYDMRGGYGVELQETAGAHDASLAYWTRIWKEHQFEPDRITSETSVWMQHFKGRILDLHDLNIWVHMFHDTNWLTKGYPLHRKYRKDTKEIHELMAPELDWYLSRQKVPYCTERTSK